MADGRGELMELNTLKKLISYDKFGGEIKSMMLYFNIYDLSKITDDMAQEYLKEKENDYKNNTGDSKIQ